MSLIPPLIWPPTEKEEERMNEPKDERAIDIDRYVRKKEKELKVRLDKLEGAFQFFNWWKKIPDGGRTIYGEGRAIDLFNDIKSEQIKEVESTLYYTVKEFALKIDDFRYLVFSVNRAPAERTRHWKISGVELPEEFRD